MQRVLHGLPALWPLIRSAEVREFLSSPAVDLSRDALLNQLRSVDAAACSWLQLMTGINLHVFRGFATENDLVDYFLNDAYASNVTVIASKQQLLLALARSTTDCPGRRTPRGAPPCEELDPPYDIKPVFVHKITFVRRKINKNCCHRGFLTPIFTRPHWGSLQRSPRHPNCI